VTPEELAIANFRSKVTIAEDTSETTQMDIYVVLTTIEARALLTLLEGQP
jgi:hypothetical protein